MPIELADEESPTNSGSEAHGLERKLAWPLAPDLDEVDRSQRMLWSCARRSLSSEDQQILRQQALALSADEWQRLRDLALRHRLAPLVFLHTAQAGLLDIMPDSVRADLKREYAHTLVNNRKLQTVLVSILAAFAARDIPVILLKGLCLAERYYGDRALRPMSDIDVLIRRRDVTRATRALRELGFAGTNGMGRPSGFYSLVSAVVVYTAEQAPEIEMHWEPFGSAAYRSSLRAREVWGRARSMDFLGYPVQYLDTADELRYLCVHAAAEHRIERLLWLVDICELVRSLPAEWDWSRFVAGTIAARVALPVGVALAYCRDALALALPGGVLTALREASTVPDEETAWDAAAADLLDERWIRATSAQVHGPLEWAIYLRGVLLPRSKTLGFMYGHRQTTGLGRLSAYARHWRTSIPVLLRAIQPAIHPAVQPAHESDRAEERGRGQARERSESGSSLHGKEVDERR